MSFTNKDFGLDRTDNTLGKPVLKAQDVMAIAVVFFCPQVPAVFGIDELRRHSDPVSGFAHATFQHVSDAELTPNFAHIRGLTLPLEAGIASNDKQAAEPRQLGDDVLNNAVAKVFLLGISTHVGEGEHRNGGPVRYCWGFANALFLDPSDKG